MGAELSGERIPLDGRGVEAYGTDERCDALPDAGGVVSRLRAEVRLERFADDLRLGDAAFAGLRFEEAGDVGREPEGDLVFV